MIMIMMIKKNFDNDDYEGPIDELFHFPLPWHQLVPRKLSDSKDRGRKSLRFVYTRHWWLSSRERSLSRSTRTLWHRRPSFFKRVWKKKRKHYEMHCERDTVAVTENLASTSLRISHRHHWKSRVGITENIASAQNLVSAPLRCILISQQRIRRNVADITDITFDASAQVADERRKGNGGKKRSEAV